MAKKNKTQKVVKKSVSGQRAVIAKKQKIAKKAKPKVKSQVKPKKIKKLTKKPVVKKGPAKKQQVKKLKTAIKPNSQKPIATMKPASSKKSQSTVDYSKAVTPLGDRLVVRQIHAEKMSPGGLYIPDMAHATTGYLKGEVLIVGQGHTTKKGFLRTMDVQKGDQILFPEFAGTKIIFNSEELHIVNETDVLGIVQK